MITYKNIKVEGSDYLISLVKLIGKQIKDIEGSLTSEFGGATCELHSVVFKDGTKLSVEGEHDCPYLTLYSSRAEQPNFDEETLERLHDEANNDSEE